MGVLSELYQVASLGTDPAFKGTDGLKLGMKYSLEMREKLFSQGRSQPMSSDPQVFAEELLRMEKVWHSLSSDVLGQALRSEDVPQRPKAQASHPEAGNSNTEPSPVSDVRCLMHALKFCGQKSCKRLHTCSFCDGAECNSQPGYLPWHLGRLKQPRSIVATRPDNQQGRNSAAGAGGKGRARSRSRSRSRRCRQSPDRQAEARRR
jgi:hypothetical protein